MMQPSFSRIFNAALTLLYPTACRVCGAAINSLADGVSCAACWQAANTDWLMAAHCGKCDAKLTHSARAGQCPHCQKAAFTVARACGAYDTAWLANLMQLKRHPHLPRQIRDALLETYDRHDILHDCQAILPVPLHEARYNERSFNQAELIADALAAHTGLPVIATCLVRAKATERHRVGMGVEERAKSLHKAFRVRAPRLVENKILLIVDDVMTTGSTAHEMAETLLKAGAREIKVLTLARAVTRYI
jgi:ComF family protein